MYNKKAYAVYTHKNCTLAEWKQHVLTEYAKLGIDPATVRPLREQHAWEGGDTTMGWAQHVWNQQKMQARTKLVKLLNPEK
jgi:hypothetical protein